MIRLPQKPLAVCAVFSLLLVACSVDSSKKKQEVPVHSLEEVLTNLTPNSNQFTIDPAEETLLKGEKGAVLYLPENAFQFEDGSQPEGEISIELKESFSLTDMIADNLDTRSGNQILETAGMVYISASADGRPLAVQEGKALVIGFPKGSQTEEMDLFYEFRIDDTTSTWIPDYQMFEAEAMQEMAADTTVSEGDQAFSLEYPIEMTEDLYDYGFLNISMTATLYDLKLVNQNRTILEYIQDPATIEDSIAKQFVENDWRVHFDLNIDEQGKINNLRVANYEYTNYNQYALNIIKDYLLNAPPFDLTMDSIQVKHDWDYLLGIQGAKRVNQDRFKRKFREQYASYYEGAIEKMGKSDLEVYLFSVTRMGWINCDRFWDIDEEEKTDFIVSTPVPEETKVQIVFKDIRSIMTGTKTEGQIVFNDVPLGREIKVIGISYANGKPTMSVAETTIGNSAIELLGFREFSLNELEKELNEIN